MKRHDVMYVVASICLVSDLFLGSDRLFLAGHIWLIGASITELLERRK